MKILLVITGLGMGGAERQICDLADGLTARGHVVKIAYLLEPVVLRPKSEMVELVWLGGKRSLLSIAKAWFNLLKLIRNTRPDVVHSHMFHSNILSRLTKIFYHRSNFVNTAHNVSEGGRVRMLAYRFTNFLADEFTNVSQEAVEAFESKKAVTKGKMIVTHNGINTDYFSFCADARYRVRNKYGLADQKVFIAIGRFHEQKDYPNLLNAFANLCKGHSNVHLMIVGDGELRSNIEYIVKNKNLENDVSFLGLRNDIPELLSAADVFVLSSAWEGFGLVVAEAMACKRVVVATDCGGVAEVLGAEGFLVEPKNDSELTVAMKKSISLSEAEKEAMGVASRNRIIENYSLQAVVDNWLVIYGAKSSSH